MAGLVVQEQSGFFWVETSDGHIYICRLRGRLLEQAQSADIAAIGDRVQITAVDASTGTIESVEPRKSILSRALRTEGNRGAGAAEREQVIIANADQAIFVFAAAQPTPSLRMLDRFLVVGEKSGIDDLVIVINKVDLEGAAPTIARFDVYRQLGYKLLHTSALRCEGIDELRELLKDRISVFTGPSGVGKSSLLNQVQPGLARSVRSVSQTRHEGLHTTRDSELVKLDFGGYLADTPGIRTLNIWDVEPEELDAYFREIAPLVAECRFADCSHRNEPGCKVRAALADGGISHSRYQSYCSLRGEMEAALDAMY
ncbi:MAG: ribosome small subunit-dependent GTPase A [Anaerolineae bacterium]|nr:ribosome small subunit-dependent GTPase A [Anaerolineae bacterium]MCA9911250.1 ribosome small subunit-dependent GTPase A [Anaerolineae bacterium]